MDLSDNFISYGNDEFLKQEKLDEQELSLSSPYSGDTDSTSLYPNSIPTNLGYFQSTNNFGLDTYTLTEDYTQRKVQPFNIIKTKKEEDCDIQVKLEPEDKMLSKSKRIYKREKAKQRNKTKGGENCFLDQVNSKYIPEGFNNPDLDDKTKKKMIQMIRNRISAQNSRDRKKAYVHQLEGEKRVLNDHIRKLTTESENLREELRRMKATNESLVKDCEDLKKNKNFPCLHCGKLQDLDSDIQSSPDMFSDNISLQSPSRFGANRSLFNLTFAFATILSCVMIMHFSNQGTIPLQNTISQDTQIRVLQESTQITEPVQNPSFKPVDETIGSTGSLILKNIRPLKQNFKDQCKGLYHSDCEKRVLITPNDSDTQIKIEENENAIVEYTTFHNGEFLSREPGLVARNLPVLDTKATQGRTTSTLLCPNVFIITDEEGKQEGMDEENAQTRARNLANSQYLQLFVPKKGLADMRITENGNNYESHISNDKDDSNGVVELWCKVFNAREISSQF